MRSKEFTISKSILEWIAESQGFSIEELANNIAPRKVEKVTQGIVNKTQARKLARLGKIPFGFLFLSEPPRVEKPKLPDFRNTLESVPLTNDFYDIYTDIREKLDWYDNYLKRNDLKDELSFVGSFSVSSSFYETAKDIRNELDMDEIDLCKINKTDYLKEIIFRSERIGILIFKNGIVNSNTHRSLDVSEFRGFAMSDKFTPAIFINANDAVSAQLFTLLHEIAHIWIGEEGISNWAYPFENKIETYCNQVASEVLMPTQEFQEFWVHKDNLQENISKLSQVFKTSELSVAIKANQLNLVDDGFVNSKREALSHYFRKQKEKLKSTGGGGSYFNTLPWRNSNRLTDTIVRDALNQNTLLTEASRLLHTQPNAILNELGARV